MSRQMPAGERVHAPSVYPNRAYCGAKNARSSGDRSRVTCDNCLSAIRADEETTR